MDLTPEQQRIVTHGRGHAKVSAVAGSGKSTTMVSRIRYLLEQGVAPQRIMVLMFNKSARDAFRRSLNAVLGPIGLPPPEVRTFHALGLRLIESFTKRGVLPVRTLFTAEFQLERFAKEAVRLVMEGHDDARDWLAKENLEGFLTFIDLVKADTRPAALLFEELGLDAGLHYYIEAYTRFEANRERQRVRFYADLIHEPVMAILADPALAEWVANRVEHLIVDEYQDINEVQEQLVKAIAGSRAQVMVVGDVDQCIYEWRGARPEYITDRFQHDFANPAIYTLSTTFRFGHRLSLAANYLIINNHLPDRKLCLSRPDSTETRFEALAEREPHPILAILADWRQQGRSLREAVALVRIFAMSVPLELALLEAGIPYRVQGHELVFACPEIMALTGFLRLCRKERELDPESVEAMLTNPHLGLKRDKIQALAQIIARAPGEAPELILGQLDRDTPPFLKRQVEQQAATWREIQGLPAGAKAHELLAAIIAKTGLFAFYRAISTRLALAENKIKTCQAFLRFAQRQNLALGPFLDETRRLHHQEEGEPTADALLITSIHRAKGLEWPLVIVPGLDDGSFPLIDGTPESVLSNLEDERRLFYVAITRAREQLYLIHPEDPRLVKANAAGASRFAPQGDDDRPAASRFLYEANLGLSARLGAAIHATTPPPEPLTALDGKVANRYLVAIDSPLPRVQGPGRPGKGQGQGARGDFLKTNEMAEGMMVSHPRFGTGVVIHIPDRRQGKVEVLFAGVGRKLLIADLAKLRAI